MRIACLVIASLALLFGSGCGGNYLYDDIDIEFDFELTNSDELHLPYVAGTEVTISASDDSGGNEAEQDWTLFSSDPSVLRINSQQDARAQCTAVGPGHATITVIDADGEQVHEGDVDVAQADHAEITPHGPMIIGRGADVPDVRMLAGGTATYLVRYYHQGVRLYGNGVLSISAPSTLISAESKTTFLFENREWLQIHGLGEGSGEIILQAAGQDVATLPLTVVGPSELSSLEVIDDERVAPEDRDSGTPVTALALARDVQHRPVYGVEVSWDIDGDGQPGLGDLFRYAYEPEVIHMLGAETAGLRAEKPIHASSGQVDSSNNLGCALGLTGRDGGGGWPMLACAALLGLAGLRRQRRAAL